MIHLLTSLPRPIVIGGICFFSLIFIISTPSYAMHPLITDDAGTQGKGVFQLEFNYQFNHDRYNQTIRDPKELVESEIAGQSVFGRLYLKESAHQAGVILAYGIIDPLDISIGIPYQHVYSMERHFFYTGPLQGFRLKESDTTTGLSDINVEFKWRFYEFKVLSFALKPGFLIPAGNEKSGLGAGKFGAYGYVIATLDLSPVIMHFNFGYIRNQNRVNEREDIWHASVAWEFWLVKDCFRLVANAGLERNRDKKSNIQDAFLLAGLIGSPTKDCDLDLGFKYSIRSGHWDSPGPDYTVLAGATIWFGWTPKDKKTGEPEDNSDKKK
jgi:hypothetical protein